jgi:ATP-dependent DNA ligase
MAWVMDAKPRLPSVTLPPIWIRPQLAQLVKAAPDAPGWLHELKMDGYRMHVSMR